MLRSKNNACDFIDACTLHFLICIVSINKCTIEKKFNLAFLNSLMLFII